MVDPKSKSPDRMTLGEATIDDGPALSAAAMSMVAWIVWPPPCPLTTRTGRGPTVTVTASVVETPLDLVTTSCPVWVPAGTLTTIWRLSQKLIWPDGIVAVPILIVPLLFPKP